MNYVTKFKFEQSTSQCGHDFSMLLRIMSLFLQVIYFFINIDEQQLFLLTQIPLTVDNNNNNNDRLTAFDPGQPG